jgi:hypothetical protein
MATTTHPMRAITPRWNVRPSSATARILMTDPLATVPTLFKKWKVRRPLSEPPDLEGRWSYGDVENNGVYYHPQMTHYAHQAFENYFERRTGVHYVDLSRVSAASENVRRKHRPPIERMTFPIGFLHQGMAKPMFAGESYRIQIDTCEVDRGLDVIAVRAWVYDVDPNGELTYPAALVCWLRWAKLLDPDRLVPIPDWFPRTVDHR